MLVFKAKHSGGLSSRCGAPEAGEPDVGAQMLLRVENSAIGISLLLVDCLLRGLGSDYMGFDYTATLPLLLMCTVSCR